MNPDNQRFPLDVSWKLLLKDLGLSTQDLLRHARLPLDLFSHSSPTVTTAEYFRFWQGLEALLKADPAFPLRLAQAVSTEAFSPPIFACFCSENLNVAFMRLAHFKPLVAPLRMSVEHTDHQTIISLDNLQGNPPLPPSLISTELVFWVHLVRLATREHIVPEAISTTVDLPEYSKYERFFEVPVSRGKKNQVRFSAANAERPFLSNPAMWSIFEPELRIRLEHLSAKATYRDRVRACLTETLASGQCAIKDVARLLHTSPRTLQRYLKAENTTFQQELNQLRQDFAQHYLLNTACSSREIAFLLGYDSANSFQRAFQNWTGQSPEQWRTTKQ